MVTMSSSENSPLISALHGGTIDEHRNECRDLNATESKSACSRIDDTTSSTHDNGVANATVFALAVVTFVQAYLVDGVFSYAGFFTLHLLSKTDDISVDEETVGKYAGFIACSFMAGRTVTAVPWGKMADTFGRIPVLQISLAASAVASIGFGFATSYWKALLWRFLMGIGNGITGTTKCLLSEIKEASGSQARQTKTIAIVYGMRGYGFLIAPAISGYLSDPCKQYPKTVSTFRPEIQSLLMNFPFLLPNLFVCGLCLLGFVLVTKNVEETLPTGKRRPFRPWTDTCLRIQKKRKHQRCDDSECLYVEETKTQPSTVTASDLLWCKSGCEEGHRRRVRRRWYHLCIYWMSSFLNIASDELFPLFCLSRLSGLGLMENQISFLLAGSTMVYGILQYFLLTGLVEKMGLYPTLRLAITLNAPLTILIPIGSLFLRHVWKVDDESRTKLNFLVVVYLWMMIATIKSFASIIFSTLVMATNKTVETIEQRATLNGIVSLGGAFVQSCGPIFSGILFSYLAGDPNVEGRTQMNSIILPPFGSIVSYGIISMLGLLVAYHSLKIPES